LAQKLFNDVDNRGRIINDSHRGPTLGDRVESAVEKACVQVLNQHGRSFHIRVQSHSRDHAHRIADGMFKERTHTMLTAIYLAAEREIFKFIRNGEQTVGRFPKVVYPCFTSSSSGDQYMNYFDQMHIPGWMAKSYRLGQRMLHRRKILGGTVLRLLLLLIGFLGFAAMGALTEILPFGGLVAQLLPGESLQKTVIVFSWILGFGSYGLLAHKTHKQRTGEDPGCLPTALLYFLLVMAVFHGGFYPLEAGFPDEMMLIYLMGQTAVSVVYFTVRLLMELWDLILGLSFWTVKLYCRLQGKEREACNRLVEFYRLWYKNAGYDQAHGGLKDITNMMDHINRWAGTR